MQRYLSLLAMIGVMFAGVPQALAAEIADAGGSAKPVALDSESVTQKPAVGGAVPRACLILPLLSDNFGRLAEPVKNGFMAAHQVDGHEAIAVKVYEVGDAPEDMLSVYRQAVADGCKAMVGPITRNGVTALAKSGLVSVPTLALNTPDIDDKKLPDQLYIFGIQVEAEARQAARYAYGEGKRRAVVVSDQTPLAKRMEQSFAEEWDAQGGTLAADLTLPGGRQVLAGLKDEVAASQPDMVFLAVGARKARLVRPYLGNGTPIYATSQVYSEKNSALRNVDINGVYFVDMPWLLQPDHPAVMVYPRPDEGYSLDMERMYALGIDAYRLIDGLLRSSIKTGVPVDGVTGRIVLSADRHFSRELPLAEFREGEARLVSQAKPE